MLAAKLTAGKHGTSLALYTDFRPACSLASVHSALLYICYGRTKHVLISTISCKMSDVLVLTNPSWDLALNFMPLAGMRRSTAAQMEAADTPSTPSMEAK